jgi:hypothetical protein
MDESVIYTVRAEEIASVLSELSQGASDNEAVDVLLHSTPSITSEIVWGGDMGIPYQDPVDRVEQTLSLSLERRAFRAHFQRHREIEQRLLELCNHYVRPEGINVRVVAVEIVPRLEEDNEWRLTATMYLAAIGLTNQGRAHSDNVAPLDFEGLKFRSGAEKRLYLALKGLAVPVAPLPVFVQGGADYERREPDFVILRQSRLCIIEVHGPLSNTSDERLQFLINAGAIVERVSADCCGTLAKARDAAADVLRRIDERLTS